MNDKVNHPPHYRQHPSGVECIEITEHMNFNKGNAIKYIWRAGDKGDEIEDLKKAAWYVNREIERLEKTKKGFYATATGRAVHRATLNGRVADSTEQRELRVRAGDVRGEFDLTIDPDNCVSRESVLEDLDRA